MIPEPKGRELVSLLERNLTVTMYISIGTRNLQKYVSRTSVVFVSISFIVLMIISLAWLVFYYIQRFRYANARDRNQVSDAGVTTPTPAPFLWQPRPQRPESVSLVDTLEVTEQSHILAQNEDGGHQL